MKIQIFSIAAFLCISFTSYSQITKGKKIIGGSLNLSGTHLQNKEPSYSNNSSTSNTYGAGFLVNAGVFVKDNLAIGIAPSITYGTTNVKSNLSAQNSNTLGYGLSLFMRKYKQINEKWYFYFQGSLNGNKSNSKSEYNNTDTLNANQSNSTSQSSRVGLIIAPGITYFISPKVAVEVQYAALNFGINHNSSLNNGLNSTTNSINYGLNLNLASINLGVLFYLGK